MPTMLAELRRRIGADWRTGLLGFAATVALALVLWLPRLSPYSDQLTVFDKFSFDWLYSLRPTTRLSNVWIIEMDQKSYRLLGQDPTRNWDRAVHTRLLRKLTRDGARIVVFDVFFDTPGQRESDQEFAEAMRAHGNVALAVDYVRLDREDIVGYEPVFPTEPLKRAAAGIGLVSLVKDTDGAVRRHYLETEDHESLSWVAARMVGAARPAEGNRLDLRWLHYYGPPRFTLPRMAYSEALEQPDEYFRDKAVFIGGAPRIKKPGQQADLFRTPYTRWDGQEASGVDLLALNFLNLQRADGLTRIPAGTELLVILFLGFAAGFGLVLLRPLAAGGVALLLAAAVTAAALALHALGHTWFSWFLLVAVEIPCGWIWSAAAARRAKASPESTALGTLAGATDGRVVKPRTFAAQQSASASAAPTARIPDHELLRCVGKGAYGEVWLARNAIGLLHAVKIIYRRAFESSEPYDREFRGITKFMPISRSHCGFVHVLHVGRDEAGAYFYYVMEVADDAIRGQEIDVEGYSPKNLSNQLRRRKRLRPDECLDLGLGLADALEHLHKAQLIHRDIKPSNIIFVQGVPKLADIGLVTHIPMTPKDISYLGTRGYIAPEGPGTPLADIYSLGKVLYEAFTGLDREQFPSLPTTQLENPSSLLTQLNQVVLKACEPDPAQRYPTAAALHRALGALRTRVAV